ncbi:radical SAM/SPASM domain-containing protein [Limnobacter sp.]|jgi:MoaA/NifB/PqqE/SkfB family radical SAM enzyme|uniref:radical SAM/SPASM domain-containing protein n=1 Tax=Limnobacter sp. TaxID=2003368 RepID=UPI0039BD0896
MREVTNVDAARQAVSQIVKPQALEMLWIEITKKCNLECEHCYTGSHSGLPLDEQMTPEKWRSAITQAYSLGCRSIQFIGGEPLIHPETNGLIEYAHKMGYEFIEVYTNGTAFNQKTAELYSRLGVRVACSVYSDKEQVHDTIVGKRGSHKKTMYALELAAAAGIPVRIGYIEMPRNAGDFSATSQALQRIGILKVRSDKVRPFGRARQDDTQPQSASYTGLCGQCGRGRLCLTNDGSIFPCIMSRSFKLGSFFESSFIEILNGIQLNSFRNGIESSRTPKKDPSPCAVCGPGNCGPDKGCSPDKPCVPDHMTCNPDTCMPGGGDGCPPHP